MKKGRIIILFMVLTVMNSCREDYRPPAISSSPGYLVVDGFLNNSTDTTFIRLSRTAKLEADLISTNDPEKNAQLSVDDEGGNSVYSFQPYQTEGEYFVPGMSLNINKKYTLKIKTADGRQYVSDNIPAILTPPIDSINWIKDDNGVTIYANTHDLSNNTRYYRWEFTDTYEYSAADYSGLIYRNDSLLLRSGADQIFYCWRTRNSSALLLSSSEKLSQDIVYEFPLKQIPLNSVELGIKYSMMAREYAITKEAYLYMQNLKKNTEEIGSLFDAQPSQIAGNVHCMTNPDEPVLGFITAANVQSKRIFIKNDEVLPWSYRPPCGIEKKIIGQDSLPYYVPVYVPLYTLIGGRVVLNTQSCADCRTFGGVTQQPDFW